jgi:hypothetical protein
MSAWVQVSAIVRIDGFCRKNETEYFDELFGKECLWDSDESVWEDAREHPNKYLPMGSEGTLQKTVWINPNENHADRYTVSIFGSLRDVWSGEWIIKWFKEKLKDELVRQATITVDCGVGDILTWTYDKDEYPINLI